MSDRSAIEWTDATWNPIRARNRKTGRLGWYCKPVSPGCNGCYAEAFNMRLGTGLPFKPGHQKDVEIFLDEEVMLAPLRWKKPRKIFVCSMTDLFADFVEDEWIDRLFAVMALCPQHTFQVLTKRAGRMLDYFEGASDQTRRSIIVGATFGLSQTLGCKFTDDQCRIRNNRWPLPNVWLGVSAERQQEADERVPLLLDTPASIRFVSAEPLLGPIDFRRWVDPSCGVLADPSHPRLDLIIDGGESGKDARPSHVDWFRSSRDQCAAALVAYFHKQNGEYLAGTQYTEELVERDTPPGECSRFPAVQWSGLRWEEADEFDEGDCEIHYRVGKQAAGRLLDGREHNDFPKVPA